jgi:glycosyltransferase involved in cell wall biosynthesis
VIGVVHVRSVAAGARWPDHILAAVPDAPVPQRCVIVLPSGDEFDSRTYRIARALHERGHEVTVVARRLGDLPEREVHPVGYAILRVDVSAVDGMPLARLMLPLLRRLRLVGRTSPAASNGARPDETGQTGASGGPPLAAPSLEPESRPARGLRAYLGRARIFFLIRSYRRRARAVAPAAHVVHGMAYVGVAVALTLGKRDGARVVYDARDIYMEAAFLHGLRGPIKAALVRLERGWARAVDRVVTVNGPYADELAVRFGVPTPLVVMNCSYRYTPPAERPQRFHERLGLDPDTRVVLYQGGFMHGRGVEELIAAIARVPAAVLVLMGYGSREAEFRAMADRPDTVGRIHVLPAVPPNELLDWVASADVVGVLFQHDTINHYLSTPNKFLEAMAAGVPSVCSDHPGMGPIAAETGCGIAVAADDIEAVVAAIRSIVEAPEAERQARRARALAAAHATYNWESQVEGLLEEYGRLTGRPW